MSSIERSYSASIDANTVKFIKDYIKNKGKDNDTKDEENSS